MTEDDTIRALKYIPFHVVWEKVVSIPRETRSTQDIIRTVHKYGYSYSEWQEEATRLIRLKQHPNQLAQNAKDQL